VIAAAKARAARGTTVVAILHDLNLAVLLARRIVVLHRGRIDADGPPEATITDAVLERVFGVAQAVGAVPAGGTPFILPHAARKDDPGTGLRRRLCPAKRNRQSMGAIERHTCPGLRQFYLLRRPRGTYQRWNLI
jgi:hypothetical protein